MFRLRTNSCQNYPRQPQVLPSPACDTSLLSSLFTSHLNLHPITVHSYREAASKTLPPSPANLLEAKHRTAPEEYSQLHYSQLLATIIAVSGRISPSLALPTKRAVQSCHEADHGLLFRRRRHYLRRRRRMRRRLQCRRQQRAHLILAMCRRWQRKYLALVRRR